MEDERVVSEIVTAFFLNTCRLHPRLSEHAVQAASFCASVAALYPSRDEETDLIPLVISADFSF